LISVDFFDELSRCQDIIEKQLDEFLHGDKSYQTLLEAIRYSLLRGGKRIRAILCLKFSEAVGGKWEDALYASCAIEMLHAYTLIHDDLPCMDDDDMRRGNPSNHIKFGESTAILAGDAMQALAFDTLLSSGLAAQTVVAMAKVLAVAAGPHGVCAGQYLDLAAEGKNLDLKELSEIYRLKTSALICASAQIGVLAGGGTHKQVEAAGAYAGALGLAFQARDDILDCTSTEKELGKPIGSDMQSQKSTLVSLLGIEKCENLVEVETSRAINALEGQFIHTEFLKSLANHLAGRKN